MLISENQGIRMSPRKRQFDLSHVMVLPFNIIARTGPKICVRGASGQGAGVEKGAPGGLLWEGLGNGC